MPVFQLSAEMVFPPPHLSTKEGLLAVGGDLRPQRLITAYKSGIFPWYSGDEPILWWSPDPRMVLYPSELKTSRSLMKIIRKEMFRVTLDTAFDPVIRRCAELRLNNGTGTWITPQMQAAYRKLHKLGYAHSVEAWYADQLIGGLYGVSLGRAFFGESMFSIMSNASKVCLYHLTGFLRDKGFHMIDCQIPSDHLAAMGARLVARKDFIAELHEATKYPTLRGSWTLTSKGLDEARAIITI
jgi:leucyl/phenylalanyl-tRNA---protein transferase